MTDQSIPSAVQVQWNENMEALSAFCSQNPNAFPRLDAACDTERGLAEWCRLLHTYHRKGQLEKAWIDKLQTINFPFKREPAAVRWEGNYKALVAFRKAHPHKWPGYRSADPLQKKLGAWCMDLRARFRNNKLNDYWIKKLQAIHFNLGGYEDNWRTRFDQLNAYVQNTGALPGAYHDLYPWCYQQYKGFNTLKEDQKRLLHSIDFMGLHKRITWERRLEELKMHLQTFKKKPTQSSAPDLKQWLQRQKERYKTGTLARHQAESLLALGIPLEVQDASELRWNRWYEKLKAFRIEHPDRWPNRCAVDEAEKKLHNWCQAQRQVYAGTLPFRKPLSPERIEKLNGIHFYWNLQQYHDDLWNAQFQQLKSYVEEQNTTPFPPEETDKPLYSWLKRQKKAYRAGTLAAQKIQKLKALNLL